jgi:hypothetical protein
MPKSPPSTKFADGGAFVVHGDASSYVNVQAFVTLERVAASESFDVSVVLQAGGQSIGKISLGTVAEGEQVLLSLSWDEPYNRFVVSSQRPGATPTESFIPLALPEPTQTAVPSEFSRNFVLNLDGNNATEGHENKN